MSKDISIQNGANLNLKGLASKEFEVANKSLTYALNPDDFFALVPRMLVKEGDFVKKGDPVFFDKNDENIKIVSPVSGKIKQIVRGEKRKILNVIIHRSGDDVRNFDIPDLKSISVESIIEYIDNTIEQEKNIKNAKSFVEENFQMSSFNDSLKTLITKIV